MAAPLDYAGPRAAAQGAVPWRGGVATGLALCGLAVTVVAGVWQNHTSNTMWYACDWDRYVRLMVASYVAVGLCLSACCVAFVAMVRRAGAGSVLLLVACIGTFFYTLLCVPL